MLQLSSDYLYSIWEVFGSLCEDFYAQAQNTLHLEEFFFYCKNTADTFNFV